ncbi:MAG: glutamine--fructose-6-phosphate transaminase (isomerizing) [Bdellovibrionaceae bacterium]|nr:glutamine--fructose-6-phosphate transaminase (isomerizing) [Pseudobdellovibrionaceae bacterium]
MCGIVGYSGKRPVVDLLLKGLKRLEYRGYDSAGIAIFEGRSIRILKSEGKIDQVRALVEAQSFGESHCGIGHTRWATHGKPTTQNAHPHQAGPVVLVHNGIIENFEEIKADIIKAGYRPQSETDSELYGFLVLDELKKGKEFVTAARDAFQKLEGSCGIVAMHEDYPGTVVGIRNGSPLVVGIDPEGGAFLASDAQPLLDYVKKVIFLENGDVAVIDSSGLKIIDLYSGTPVSREETELQWSAQELDKQGYEHYMLKEIFEQPDTITHTVNGLLDRSNSDPFPLVDQPGLSILQNAKSLTFIACGTSWHAALTGKYWIEKWAEIPVEVELASEFRYRSPVIRSGTVVVGVSQSGETADTLSVLRAMKAKGIPTLGITNVRGSTIEREADAVFHTSAGPEIGVAATKTFTAQLVVFLLWAGYLGFRRDPKKKDLLNEVFQQLVRFPHALSEALQPGSHFVKQIQKVASEVYQKKGFFFMGRGYSFPIALEGALKLKEIAYVHAEGYAAGELKHGPIAMIDQEMVVVVLSPKDEWRDKTISNLQEVKARGAIVLASGDPEDQDLKKQCDYWIPIPHFTSKELNPALYPFLVSSVIQLLSYEIAVLKGTEIDQPRNLAKSVTVE